MMRLILTFLLLVALTACGGSETRDDGGTSRSSGDATVPATDDKDDGSDGSTAHGAEESAEEEGTSRNVEFFFDEGAEQGPVRGTIIDREGTLQRIERVRVVVTTGSFFGPGTEERKSLEVRVGRGRIEVPLHRLSRLRVSTEEKKEKAEEEAPLSVELTNRDGRTLEGHMDPAVQLRGATEFGPYTIELRDLRSAEFKLDR